MRILSLDDMESRQSQFRRWFAGHTHDEAFDAKVAIGLLENFDYDLVMLDHDLAEEHYLIESEGLHETRQPGQPEYTPGTGMDVVDYIVKMPIERRPKTVVVHSYNFGRSVEMYVRLNESGIRVYRIPFGNNPLGS
jgi:hypothetical protein